MRKKRREADSEGYIIHKMQIKAKDKLTPYMTPYYNEREQIKRIYIEKIRKVVENEVHGYE